MGLDLTLVFDFAGTFSRPPLLAYNRLMLDRDYGLFEQISNDGGYLKSGKPVCKPKPLPPKMTVQWYEDEGLKKRTEDPYGSELTYVTVRELAKATATASTPWNKAVWAMIQNMDPDDPVVLWWH